VTDTIELMKQKLATLAPEQVEITDESALHAGHAGAASGGGHFQLIIVSNRFAGLSTVARHRAVYEALGKLMGSRIHALSMATLTPDEL
jgi:BolA family transcriptional regulator, general stress-responsive regulator